MRSPPYAGRVLVVPAAAPFTRPRPPPPTPAAALAVAPGGRGPPVPVDRDAAFGLSPARPGPRAGPAEGAGSRGGPRSVSDTFWRRLVRGAWRLRRQPYWDDLAGPGWAD